MSEGERGVDPLRELIGDNPGMVALRRQVDQFLRSAAAAPRLPAVLILGETGSGKGLLARAIHGAGPRARRPFIDVNCAAIPERLLEAELFGYEKGAFTDARQAKPGLFQLAHQGSLFLDEIGLLALPLQSKLLTALEQRVVRRLGSTHSEPAEVWVIAATNENIRAAVDAHHFRQDLYHRLAVITLCLPPLRQRGANILMLAHHFLARACEDYRLAPKSFAPDAGEALAAHSWPGNVRELSNVIERVVLLGDGPVVTAAVLGLPAGAVPEWSGAQIAAPGSPQSKTSEHLLNVLTQTGWNISRTAAVLGISWNTVKARIARLGLDAASTGRPAPASPPSRPFRRGSAPKPLAPSARADRTASFADVGAPSPASPARTGVRSESRQVGMLRIDLEFGSALEGLPETGRVLDEVLDKIQSFGGRVEELGDATVIAAFGVDQAVEDAAIRAALAGLAVRRMVERDRASDRLFSLRGAVHTANVSARQAREAALIDLAHKQATLAALAALVSAAPAGSIVASEDASPLLRRRFLLTPLPATQGARAHVISGLESTRFRPGGRMAAFIGPGGRAPPAGAAHGADCAGPGSAREHRRRAGHWQIAPALRVPPDLAAERSHLSRGQCVSYGAGAPFLPIIDVVRAACAVADTDAPDVVSDKVHRTLVGLSLNPEDSAPFLIHLLGGSSGQRLAGLSPEVVAARTLQAFVMVSLSLSRRQPLVVAIEDLQWIDRSSEAYLAALAEHLVGARILLLLTYRPAERPAFADCSDATKIGLPPLTPDEVASIARSVLGAAVAEDTARLIANRAGGNPLFAEELTMALAESETAPAAVAEPEAASPLPSLIDRTEGIPFTLDESLRTLVETHVLVGEPGAYRPTPARPAIDVPATIHALLAARIDRLAQEDKSLLQMAAVIGMDVPYRLLCAIAERPELSRGRGPERINRVAGLSLALAHVPRRGVRPRRALRGCPRLREASPDACAGAR